jgi:hypothetical protein
MKMLEYICITRIAEESLLLIMLNPELWADVGLDNK